MTDPAGGYFIPRTCSTKGFSETSADLSGVLAAIAARSLRVYAASIEVCSPGRISGGLTPTFMSQATAGFRTR